MKKVLFLVLALFVVIPLIAQAATSTVREVSWLANPTTYEGGAPIPATDNLIGHVFVCTSPTDNTTCVEVGQSAPNAKIWTGDVPQNPPDTTRYYRVRSESRAHNATGGYSLSTPFFLQGTEAPGAPAAPAVR